MAKITGTFNKLWKQGMEDDARRLGVIDGDLAAVRAKVKNTLVSGGWANAEGNVEFVTEQDAANALQAAQKTLIAASERLAKERKVVRTSSGVTPTKASVLSASTVHVDPSEKRVVNLTSAGNTHVDASAFSPKMGEVGDRCPRCRGSMDPVGLVNDRAGLYCTRDRVVVPLPTGTQVRY